MSFRSDIRHQWLYGTAIMKILMVNVAIFLLQIVALIVARIFSQEDAYLNWISRWFYASTDIGELLRRPWTIFTYMFMHDLEDIFHIISNMLYLFFFGRIFSDIIQQKMAYPLYLLGGVAGLLVELIVINIIPDYRDSIGSLTVGASAAVMAIVLATATLQPDYSVHLILIGPVKLKYIAAFVVIIDLISISAEQNLGGHLAHVGGALTGFLYIRSYRRSGNWFSWWPRFEQKVHAITHPKKTRVAYVNPNMHTTRKSSAAEEQEKLNAILDKIKASGYDSLSKAEKAFLFTISNKK